MHLKTSFQIPSVAEIQGLYGAFSFPEKLLQKIWHRGDFDRRNAKVADGRSLQILRTGKWNLLGGPDFKNASIRLGDTALDGDIEVHLRPGDWAAHGHSRDPAYAKVILHVVLFPEEVQITSGFAGQEIPILAMLPLLRHDLEEYAADEAVERLAQHPLSRAEEKLLGLSEDELRSEMTGGASRRWERKVHFARSRIERDGWERACHETALEILGYRFNRAPMLSVALEYPLEVWRKGESEEIVEQAYSSGEGRWTLQGVRPANHPRVRLQQYAAWATASPDWTRRLEEAGTFFEKPGEGDLATLSTRDYRREINLASLREALLRDICGGVLGGTRFDTVVCDGLLPLLAARSEEMNAAYFAAWYHWFLGDAPASFSPLLKGLGLIDGSRNPRCHGLSQGLLGWLLTHEATK